MKTVLVTGADGQLGKCIKDVAKQTEEIQFIFTNSSELDITKTTAVTTFFSDKNIDYCINCAAYTAVDKAENEVEKATKINVDGVQNLAETCKENNTILIHISTDFVFDGIKNTPYLENDVPNPQSVYGSTKLAGEKKITTTFKKYVIIRTSWLYSEYGHNFMKTMLRLGNERSELGVVNDQKGTPTYTQDLAKVIIQFIKATNIDFGIYHYSNDGETTWYEFAKEIFKQTAIKVSLKPINTTDYPTPANRPKYSVLSTSKIEKTLNIKIPNWKDSLKEALKNN